MIKKVFVLSFVLFFSKPAFSQCTYSAVSSTYGWTATVSYSVTSVVVTAPSPSTSCATNSYYQFAPVVSYSVTFTGGASNRSITLANLCVNCLNKDGATKCTDCVSTVGTFNANATGSLIVNNNSCEYDATYVGPTPTYPSPKISCTALNLNNAGCNSAYMDIQYTNVNPNDSYISAYPCLGIAPLPIELLSFKAWLTDNGTVNLSWETATETNNRYFTIEKTKDMVNFVEVAKVDGAGNSTQTLNYTEIDYSPYGGISYYRLKQTDNNGNFKYFPIVVVENKMAGIIISNVHPNPTTGNFSFNIYSPNKGTLRMQLIDNVGRIIFDNTQSINDNQKKIDIETTSIPQGVYILKTSVVETGISSVNKIIKN